MRSVGGRPRMATRRSSKHADKVSTRELPKEVDPLRRVRTRDVHHSQPRLRYLEHCLTREEYGLGPDGYLNTSPVYRIGVCSLEARKQQHYIPDVRGRCIAAQGLDTEPRHANCLAVGLNSPVETITLRPGSFISSTSVSLAATTSLFLLAYVPVHSNSADIKVENRPTVC